MTQALELRSKQRQLPRSWLGVNSSLTSVSTRANELISLDENITLISAANDNGAEIQRGNSYSHEICHNASLVDRVAGEQECVGQSSSTTVVMFCGGLGAIYWHSSHCKASLGDDMWPA